jgi:HEAT repeat protein
MMTSERLPPPSSPTEPRAAPSARPTGQTDPVAAGQATEGGGWNLAIYGLLGLIGLLTALIVVVIAGKTLRPYLVKPAISTGEKTFNEALARLKKGPQERDRREAAEAIVGLGPEAVMRALAATTEASADQSTLALSKPVNLAFAQAGEPAVAAMIEGIGSDQLAVRVAAVDVLREMGPRAVKAVPTLAAIVGDENRWVRSFACNALGNVGPAAAPAVEALLRVVQHADPYTRRHAIVALGQIGPAAVKAVPALQERAGDTAEKDDVREAAVEALYQVNLAQLEKEALVKAAREIRDLAHQVRGSDQFEAVAAAKTLARKGPEARLAIPSLALALGSADKWVREASARALGEMGRDAKVVRPALEQAGGDQEPEVREAAEKALAKITEQ